MRMEHMLIKFIKGNLIELTKQFKFDIILHGANIYHTMGLFTDEDIVDWQFKTQEDILVWGRRIIEQGHYFAKKTNPELSITYCGHTPVESPIQIMNHRYIDTGAVFAITK